MAIQVQIRRGTTSENNAFTGAAGEITCDIDTHTLRIHDGSTIGGFVVDQSANVVHKTGNQNEEITGTKTFTANPYITKNDPAIITNNKYVTLPNPTNYDTSAYSCVMFNDKNGKELGYCRHRYHTQNNINYSSMELIAMDPDTTHYNNRIISTNNITYVFAGDDNTNRVRKWKKENTITPIYYTPYTGTTAEPVKQPAVGTNIYSDITCQTAIDTIAQIGATRINSILTLEAKGGTERYAYLNFNPPANSSTSSTHLVTVGWCNDYQLSTNLVHRDSAETITGNKTFSGTNTFSGSNTFSSSVSLGSSATATTQAAGDNSTKVATTAFCRANHGFIVADWYSGASYYRKYSNGWIEQGGASSNSANPTVNFNLKMNAVGIYVTSFSQYAGERMIQLYYDSVTTTNFRIVNRGEAQVSSWHAVGWAT